MSRKDDDWDENEDDPSDDYEAVGGGAEKANEICLDYIELMPDEEVIRNVWTGSPNCLVLSTHRIRFVQSGTGSFRIVSVMLEQVASSSTLYTSNPWLLILAILLGVGGTLLGVGMHSLAIAILSVIAMIVLGVAYLATRRRVLSVASAGEAIQIELSGWSNDDVLSFINDLETAKSARYDELRSNPLVTET